MILAKNSKHCPRGHNFTYVWGPCRDYLARELGFAGPVWTRVTISYISVGIVAAEFSRACTSGSPEGPVRVPI